MTRCAFILLLVTSTCTAATSLDELHQELVDSIQAEWQQQATGDQQIYLRLLDALETRSPIIISRKDGRTRQDLQWAARLGAHGWTYCLAEKPVGDRIHFLHQDPSALQLSQDGRVHGNISCNLFRGNRRAYMERYTVNFQGVAKSQKVPVPDWHIGDSRRLKQHRLNFAIDAKTLAGGVFLDATLVDGLKAAGRQVDVPMTMCYHRDHGSLYSQSATPNLNRAAHRVRGENLQLINGRLTGTLLVEINRDQWLPRQTGPHGILSLRIACDIPVDGDYINHEVDVSSVVGSYKARLQGRCAPALVGSYSVTGLDGATDGRLIGGLAPSRRSLPRQLSIRQEHDTPAHRYKQIGALLRLHQEPALVDTSLLHEQLVSKELSQQSETMLKLAKTAVKQILHSKAQPKPRSLPARFGPFSLTQTPCAHDPEPPHKHLAPTPNADQSMQWYALTRWQGTGPYASTRGKGNSSRSPMLPDNAPGLAGADWQWDWREDRLQLPGHIAHSLKKQGLSKPSALASCTIHSTAEQEMWLAIQCTVTGSCWLNGQLIWESGSDSHAQTSILPIRLQAGDNSLQLRITGSIGTGRYSAGQSDYNAFRCHLGHGKPTTHSRQTTLPAQQPWSGWRHNGNGAWPHTANNDSPVAWSLKHQQNIAWTTDIPAGTSGEAVSWKDELIIASKNGSIHNLDSTSGQAKWSYTSNCPSGKWGLAPVATDHGCFLAHSSGALIHLNWAGKLVWQQTCKPSEQAPALIYLDSTLIVSLPNEQGGHVSCFDPATGKELWTVSANRSVHKIIGARLAGPQKTHAIVVSSGGCLIDAQKGTVLLQNMTDGVDCHLAPLIDQQTIYLRSAEYAAHVFVDDNNQICLRRLYEIKRYKKYGYPTWPTDPSMLDGTIYMLRAAPEHSTHGPYPADHLYQTDAETGCLIGHRKPTLWGALHPQAVSSIGQRIYATDRGGEVFASPNTMPQIAVAAHGDPCVLFGASEGTKTGIPPIPAGKHLILVDTHAVHGVGPKDEDGKRYQAQRAFAYMYDREIGRRPPPRVVKEITPLAPDTTLGALADGIVTVHRSGVSPWRWLISNHRPFDSSPEAVPDALLPIVQVGQNKGPWSFRPIEERHLYRKVMNGNVGGSLSYSNTHHFSPLEMIDRQPHRSVWLFTILRIPQKQAVVTDLSGNGLQAWVNGIALKDHDVLRLQSGDYAIHVHIGINRIPPRITRATAACRFQTIDDPANQLKEWESKIKRLSPHLHWAMQQDPGGRAGQQAQFLLRAVEKK